MTGPGFYQEELETASRAALRQVQERRWKALLRYALSASKFYREKLKAVPRDLPLERAAELPFTTREGVAAWQEAALRSGRHPSDGLFCVPPVSMVYATRRASFPVFASTQDFFNTKTVAARALTSLGLAAGDRIHMAMDARLSLLYNAVWGGAQMLNLLAISAGAGGALRQVRFLMPRLKPVALCATPTYALYLASRFRETGVRVPEEAPLKTLFGYGEPGYSLPGVRKRLEESFPGARVHDLYGISEIGLVAGECHRREGLHGAEDLYYYEVVDPRTGEPRGPGETGELVVTPLYNNGMVLLRYRTGDITSIEEEPCGCGRTHLRLAGVRGRREEALEMDGRTLYPSQVHDLASRLGVSCRLVGVNGGVRLQTEGPAGPLAEAVERELGVRIPAESASFQQPVFYTPPALPQEAWEEEVKRQRVREGVD